MALSTIYIFILYDRDGGEEGKGRRMEVENKKRREGRKQLKPYR